MVRSLKVAGPPAKYDTFAKWVESHPEKLKMPKAEFDALMPRLKQCVHRNNLPIPAAQILLGNQ
jgi:hypothetical protein